MGKRLIGSVGLAIAGGTPSPYTRTTSFVIACGAEDEALTTGTKVTFRLPFAFTVTEVRASLTTAGSGANLVTLDFEAASIDCDVDQIDSGGASKGLKMYLIGYKTL